MRRGSLIAWTLLRTAYGAFFLVMGIVILVSLTTGLIEPPAQPTAEAAAFTSALSASGFVDPLLGVSFVLGGGAMLFDRTAPLGILLLAPSVAVILFFHLLLSGQAIWGLVVASALAALAWRYRRAFIPLWSHRGHASRLPTRP